MLLSVFLKIVARYSRGLVIDYDYFYKKIKHLLVPARNLRELDALSDASDAVSAYLWLSYRFPVSFCRFFEKIQF